MAQKDKAKFRSTAKWKKFRKSLKDSRKRDEVTLKPLYKGFSVHHLDLDEGHYTDLTDPSHFACLNKKTHDFIHWAYQHYTKDPSFLERVEVMLDRMAEINHSQH